MGSTAVVLQEDGGPWIYGTVVGRGNHCYSKISHTIRLTNTGHIISRNRKHNTAEQYLRYQLSQHTKDPLDKILK